MKPRKFRQEHAVDGDWSRWVQPVMRKYLMACCDCGLVHEMQFQALQQLSEPNAKGELDAKRIRKGRVSFRVRRAPGHTKKIRASDKTLKIKVTG